MSFVESKFDKTRLAYREYKAGEKFGVTSRRAYLTDLQDTIFITILEENLPRIPLSEQALEDPKFYAEAMHRAAAISEDEVFMALSSSLKNMMVQDIRVFVSKFWPGTIDDDACKYAEALNRPEREAMLLRPSKTV